MASVADLRRFRAAGDTPQPGEYTLSEALYEHPDVELLCSDQSLRNCALVVLSLKGGRLSIPWSTTLRTKTTEKGNEGNLARSVQLQEMLDDCLGNKSVPVDLVVHETPAAASRVQRPESSLMAAHCLRWTCKGLGLSWVSIGAQKARAHVCGNSRADKAEGHDALRKNYGPLIEGYSDHMTNEHVRDSLMLGLTYLEA